MKDPRIGKMVLYAWVGEDELGSGEVGIKAGICPSGCVPLVACKEGKIDTLDLIKQLQKQASAFGKTIRLCKFVYAEQVMRIEP